MPPFIDASQKFVDENLQAVRVLPTVLGLSGCFLLAKHFYLFSHFQKVSHIPVEVFSRGLKFRGLVKAVTSGGEIEIVHLPSINIFRRNMQTGTLPILLPLKHSEESLKWITENIKQNSRIYFTPLGLSCDKERLIALLFLSRGFYQRDVTYTLLRRGLSSLSIKMRVNLMEKRLRSYQAVQSSAIRSYKGIWKKSTDSTGVFSYIKWLFMKMWSR